MWFHGDAWTLVTESLLMFFNKLPYFIYCRLAIIFKVMDFIVDMLCRNTCGKLNII